MTEGCKRYKKPDAAIPAKKTDKKPLKKGVKKPIPADTPLDVPSKPSIFSDTEEFPPDPPMVASGLSSGHKDPEPAAPEPQPEVKSEVKPESKVEIKVEDRKEPMAKGTLSVAFQRSHEKLQSTTELLKLHLKHYRMSTEQFKRRTSALKLPKEIYEKYDAITKSCGTCSKSKIAPSRVKASGIRSEVFGELTFIDHGEVPINAHSKLQFLLLFDGATSLTTAYVVQNRSDATTILLLLEYFEAYQLNPKYIVADQAFMGPEMEDYYNRHNIRPISLGPGTPWPNRAEAAIRLFKKQANLMLVSLKEDPLLANIPYRQVLRQACISRNTMITHGGVTPLERYSIWTTTCRFDCC
eukprot:s1543_g33.t1